MADEITILALYGLFVLIVVVLQVLAAMSQVGLPELASPRDTTPSLTGTAGRVERALNNSVVALALFAPAVLILKVQDASTGGTLLAAQIFVIARILYVGVYVAGIPWLRTGIWMLGFLATAYLYLVPLI